MYKWGLCIIIKWKQEWIEGLVLGWFQCLAIILPNKKEEEAIILYLFRGL